MSSDWVMVFITAVYVVATIFICAYNKKSAESAEAQTKEMKKQFLATNRPIVTVEVVYLKRSFWALRLHNHGTPTAFNTKVILDLNFIESLPEEKFRKLLRDDEGKVRTIGVNQYYDLFFGSNKYRKINNKLPLKGSIIYNGRNGSVFVEDFEIEMQNYGIFFSVDSEMEDLKKQLKKQNEELKLIRQTLQQANRKSTEESNGTEER